MIRFCTLCRFAAAILVMFVPSARGGTAWGETSRGSLPPVWVAGDGVLTPVATSLGVEGRLPDSERLAASVTAAARGARDSGGEGVLIDLAWGSPFWDGARDLRSVRLLGRNASAAAGSVFPDGVIVCLAGADVLDGGPSGVAFMAGLLEGLPPSSRSSVALLLEQTGPIPLESLLTAVRRARAVLERYAGAVAASRLLVGRHLSRDTASLPQDSVRAIVAAAQLTSDAGVFIDAPGAGPGDTATPLEGLIRAGMVSFGAGQAIALRTPSGAGLVPLRNAGAVDLTLGEDGVTMVNLGRGEPEAIAPDGAGVITIPMLDSPTLVDGLPMAPWLLEAGLTLLATPWDGGETRVPIRFGFHNTTALRIEGIVQCLAPPGYSVTPADLAVSLAPGEAAETPAYLAGRAAPGEAVSLRVTLSMPGEATAARTTELRVLPREAWRAANPAPVVTGPIVTGAGPAICLWAHEHGGLAAVDVDGALQWEASLPGGPVGAVVAGSQWHGLPLYGAVFRGGAFHAFGPGGNALWRWEPAEPAEAATAIAASLHASPGVEWAVAFRDSQVQVVSAQGVLLRRIELDGPALHLAAAPYVDGLDTLAVAIGGSAPALTALASDGTVRYTVPLSQPPVAAPAFLGSRLIVPNGAEALVVDASSGETVGAIPVSAGSIRGVAAFSERAGDMAVLLAADDRIECRGLDGTSHWSVLIGSMYPPAVYDDGARSYVAVAGRDDVLYLLDDDGTVLWEDDRAGHALIGSPRFAVSDDAGLLVMQASRDGLVRAVYVENEAPRP